MDLRQNYFELFGLAIGFEVDGQALASCYRELQKALHPDKYTNASDRERRLSLQQAAQVNAAYKTLKDPLSRASYILSLLGQNNQSDTATINDPEFLEAQMELRESLSEIRHSDDPQGQLMDFHARLQCDEKAYITQLKNVFMDMDSVDMEQANRLVQRMQFLRRLQHEAEALEEELL